MNDQQPDNWPAWFWRRSPTVRIFLAGGLLLALSQATLFATFWILGVFS
jgi:hypothetical protein